MGSTDTADTGCGTWDLRDVPRVLAVGDVQSNFTPLAGLLESAGYLAWEGARPIWRAGDAVLLLLGDLLDGGSEPSEILSMLAALSPQALAAGGRLALLRGNHELMLLAALRDGSAVGASVWFANGGLETLARLSIARGRPVSDGLRARILAPVFGASPDEDGEIRELLAFVRDEYGPELAWIETESRAAALINGCVLAVHGSPNFSASSWRAFSLTQADDHKMAWDRDWVRLRPAAGEEERDGTRARLAELKRRLERDTEGIALRHVLFAHTELEALVVPGLRGRQYRVGRVVEPEPEVPAAYSLLTVPRGIAPGGALGGLELSAEGIVALYSGEIRDGERVWSARETLAAPDPAFAGGRLRQA